MFTIAFSSAPVSPEVESLPFAGLVQDREDIRIFAHELSEFARGKPFLMGGLQIARLRGCNRSNGAVTLHIESEINASGAASSAGRRTVFPVAVVSDKICGFFSKRVTFIQTNNHSIYREELSFCEGARMNGAAALEKHYRVRELATLWGFSDNTIIRIFANEPGVIRLSSDVGRRKYITLSIPESVALRVHERLGCEPLGAQLSRSNPLRIIRLRDLHAGVANRPRNIIKLKTSPGLTEANVSRNR